MTGGNICRFVTLKWFLIDVHSKWNRNILTLSHALINYIDTKAKCRHLKTFTCKGTLRQVIICLRPPPLLWPIPPLTHCTVYVYTVYLFTQGRGEGGGGEPERRLEGQYFHDWLYHSSINSDKHLPQSPFTGQLFKTTTFSFGVYIVHWPMLMKTYWPVSSMPVSSTPSIRSLTESLLAHTTEMLKQIQNIQRFWTRTEVRTNPEVLKREKKCRITTGADQYGVQKQGQNTENSTEILKQAYCYRSSLVRNSYTWILN